jgi:transposase-like protein
MSPGRDEKPPAPGDNEAFLAWLETVPDPERRYSIATSRLEEYQEMVSRLSALRAGAVADASEEDSVSSVARRFGVSRQRAYQLLQEAKSREPAAPEGKKRRTSRQKGRKK